MGRNGRNRIMVNWVSDRDVNGGQKSRQFLEWLKIVTPGLGGPMRRLSPDQVARMIALVNQSPYIQLLNIRVVELGCVGASLVAMELERKHQNPFGEVHGGACTSAIDTAAECQTEEGQGLRHRGREHPGPGQVGTAGSARPFPEDESHPVPDRGPGPRWAGAHHRPGHRQDTGRAGAAEDVPVGGGHGRARPCRPSSWTEGGLPAARRGEKIGPGADAGAKVACRPGTG